MSDRSSPPEPEPLEPPKTWEHYPLYRRVKDAIASLPIHFQTETHIEGISAVDIFTLSSVLGATIETQVVDTLNRIRTTWDRDGDYSLYGFVRQPQTFPDVLLRRMPATPSNGNDILMGIELKGWYLLSKEGEPSFRYSVTPAACAEADLLVCVPWALRNVLSGRPAVFRPYLVSARYAAELRNYHWQHRRDTRSDTTIHSPSGEIGPYPSKADQIADRPKADGGGNFGRYARTGIMDEFIFRALQEPLCGIPGKAWLEFFKLFTESSTGDEVAERVRKIKRRSDRRR